MGRTTDTWGFKRSWSDVSIKVYVCLERVTMRELPTLIGESGSLDKRIAVLLQTEKDPSRIFFRHGNDLLDIKLPPEDTVEIEAEVGGMSSGYYDPGTWHTPTEHEDEREMTDVILSCYDEDGYLIKEIEVKDITDFDCLEAELHTADLE